MHGRYHLLSRITNSEQSVVMANQSLVIGHFGKYHNTLCLSPQSLHKHCFCFLLGPLYVPRGTGNNAYVKFGGTNKEYYGIFRSGLLVTQVITGMRTALTLLLLLFTPYKFLVCMMIKFRITKEKEKEKDAIKRLQQNV